MIDTSVDFGDGFVTCRNESRVTLQFSPESHEGFVMSAHSCIPIPSVFTTSYHSILNEEFVIQKMDPLSRFEVSRLDLFESD